MLVHRLAPGPVNPTTQPLLWQSAWCSCFSEGPLTTCHYVDEDRVAEDCIAEDCGDCDAEDCAK